MTNETDYHTGGNPDDAADNTSADTSVGASVGASVDTSVGASVGASVGSAGHNDVEAVRRRLRDRISRIIAADRNPSENPDSPADKAARGEADAMTRLIFEALKGWSVTDLLIHADSILSDYTISEIDRILARLAKGEPLQYILGLARFYGLDIRVSPDVLIPRHETEELVDLIVSRYRDCKDLRILDIATGSGCIALALARALPFADVSATDISDKALDIARQNARNLRTHINFRHADILDMPDNLFPPQSFDIIVSNPPYILPGEAGEMERNVLDYEPHRALFVPDDNPLIFYRHIALFALKVLKPGGRLYFEINPLCCKQLREMLVRDGYRDITVDYDISHRERFISAQL